MFYVCSYILTLCTARVWATSLLLSALSWQMPGEVRGRQPQSKHTHPVSLYPADGAGLQLCYLPLAFLSSTSSRVHYCAIFKKKNDLLMLHRNGNKSGRATNQSSVLQHLETMLSAPYYFKLQTTRRSLPYNKCMGSCGFQPRPQLSYMEILERFR